ncbi:MAG: hypothetical protein WC421_00740 [Elusimicrobiales bacterium]
MNTNTPPRSVKIISLSLCAAFALFAFRHFLTGRFLFTHDNRAMLASFQIFYSALFSGHLPLWSPQLNCGHPLWPFAELHGVCDPLAFIAWAANYFAGANSMLALQQSAALWLAAFGLGALLCALRMTKNWWAALAVFLACAAGPAMEAGIAQLTFLAPYRYFPLVLWLFMRAWDKPCILNGVLLGAAAFLGNFGYLTIYPALAFAVFAPVYAAARGGARAAHWKAFGAAALVFAAGIAPSALAALKVAGMAPVLRRAFNYGFMLEPQFAFATLLSPVRLVATWQGGLHIGPAFAAFGTAGFLLAAADIARRKNIPPEETAFAALFIICIVPALGLFGIGDYFRHDRTFLLTRNWGFMLTPAMLALLMLALRGFERFCAAPDRRLFMALQLPLAAVAACFAAGIDARHLHPPFGNFARLSESGAVFAASAAALYLAACAALLWLMRRRNPGAVFFAATAAAVIGYSRGYETVLNTDFAPDRSKIPVYRAQPPLEFPQYRPYGIDIYKYAAYPMMAPAVYGVFTAVSPAVVVSKEDPGLLLGMANFASLKYYDALAGCSMPESYKKKIFGVTAPVLRLAYNAVPAHSPEEAYYGFQHIPSPEFFDESAVIENPPPQAGALLCSPAGWKRNRGRPGGEVRALGYSQTELRAAIETAQDAFLVFADNYDSGWRAEIDGRPAPLYRANLINKAVFVPAGRHEVLFSYCPAGYLAAFVLRLLALLAAAFTIYRGRPL